MEELEKSFIVGVFEPGTREYQVKQVLEELKLLTESAGGEVVDSFYQIRKAPDKQYLIGTGKTNEIKDAACAKGVKLVVFYNRLTNAQQRNLEEFFNIKIIDRTRLILDVFAGRARSMEGKLQVELAQMLYLLPRLTGKGVELSRLGGGIGTRGPGETKLEADRRTINKRIAVIKKKLDAVIKNRDIQRKNRKANPIPVISLVGYTSAGKSTLFRALTGQDVFISRMLFSTLDPVLRRVDLNEIEEGYAFLLSDTVGFIREMPKELFQAFKATLEEIVRADIVLHIIDASDPAYSDREEDVRQVLEEMDIPDHKVIPVYNKADLLENYHELPGRQDKTDTDTDTDPGSKPGKIYISAKEGQGLLQLKKAIFKKCFNDYERYTVSIPLGQVNLDSIRKWAIVLDTRKHLQDDSLVLEILCSKQNMLKFKEKYGGYVQ